MNLWIGCVISWLLPTQVMAGAPVVIFDKLHKEVFQNTNCEQNDTCSLARFYLQFQDYHVPLEGSLSNGTRMFAGYETDTVENLGKYGIAQFIRGCHFDSAFDGNRIIKTLNYSRYYYGKIAPYVHPKWVIDGFVDDPLEWGEKKHPEFRHLYYQWNTVVGSHEKNTRKYVIESPPEYPNVYVSDHPGVASYHSKDRSAHNISLEFRTCLYKADEVSRSVAAENLDFAKPIHCFNWKSSFIYDHKSQQYEVHQEIDPVCTQTDSK